MYDYHSNTCIACTGSQCNTSSYKFYARENSHDIDREDIGNHTP